MDLEPSDHEPEEFDPESDLYDPNSDSLTIPQIEADASDADPELVTMFWALVLVTKASVLATALGVLLLTFDVMPKIGLVALAAGFVLAGFAVYRYRSFDPSAVSSDDGDDDGTDDDTGRPAEDDDHPVGEAPADSGRPTEDAGHSTDGASTDESEGQS